MCQTRGYQHQQQQNNNMQNQAGNLYPDLSGFGYQQQQQQQQTPPILQFLQALGLVPPQPSPSAPVPPQSAPTAPPSAPASDPAPPPSAPEAETPEANQQGYSYGQQQQQPFQGLNDMFAQGGWSWPSPPPAPRPAAAGCPCSGFTFLKHFFETLRQVFRNSVMASSALLGLMVVWLLTPTCLLQGAAFLVLASGLGLPLPALVAGQVLRAAIGCLGAAEPLLLAGLLVWAVHKMAVRRQPLLDRTYWGRRFGNLGAAINQECRQYQQQQRNHQH